MQNEIYYTYECLRSMSSGSCPTMFARYNQPSSLSHEHGTSNALRFHATRDQHPKILTSLNLFLIIFLSFYALKELVMFANTYLSRHSNDTQHYCSLAQQFYYTNLFYTSSLTCFKALSNPHQRLQCVITRKAHGNAWNAKERIITKVYTSVSLYSKLKIQFSLMIIGC